MIKPSVSAAFEKDHKHVLCDIDGLIAKLGPVLDGFMFQQLSAFNPTANRETRYFIMDRDGFALLAMGMAGGKHLMPTPGLLNASTRCSSVAQAHPEGLAQLA
ncbi:Rha family transcriptional regulator [Methylobacterium sp. Leaf108]|uniref:Rha family transcriptional regulator n=1 Tax=Methylobacterium sp. Leaf108 TaxID=1736256 RepID=UPI000701A3B2|nr:Rha family transcriptional regulator [Methylobacterium sp. Leaf108]KQP60627.1 hypothetical protein ASF39_15805 [Methylobacterium sp. Leaf108]